MLAFVVLLPEERLERHCFLRNSSDRGLGIVLRKKKSSIVDIDDLIPVANLERGQDCRDIPSRLDEPTFRLVGSTKPDGDL